MPGERDLTKLSAVRGLAAWLGKGSGALVVMVLRGDDVAFWIAPEISPQSGVDAVEVALPELLQSGLAQREEARAKAAEAKRKQQERDLRERR